VTLAEQVRGDVDNISTVLVARRQLAFLTRQLSGAPPGSWKVAPAPLSQ
jgi:hypothetical protein